MSALLQFDDLDRADLPSKPLHLAIGMFDGVHRGHQSVISAAVSAARRDGGLAGVLTFWPHPSALFRPGNPTPLIMPPAMKHRVLAGLGIDFVIEQNFSREFAAVEAREFVPCLRRALPQLAAVYVGENWRFGRGRTGDVALLIEEGRKAGLTVISMPRLTQGDAPISSSRIRELLAAGKVSDANALFGYAYFSEGVVAHGRQLGRTIGFPTLNVPWEPELKPAYGVYAVTVQKDPGQPLPGVANYGLRPTVESTAHPLLEVHLLEPAAVTYGDAISVNWLQFLRPERKFDRMEDLRQQIGRDRDNAVEFFGKRPVG